MGILSKDYIVGVDIGSSSVKLAQFTKRKEGLCLTKVSFKEIDVLNERNPDEDKLIGIVRELLKGISISNSEFILSINCPKTYIRTITVPYMPKAELEEGIRLTARNFFPFSIENALLDFQILGDTIEKGVKKYRVMIATSPKETVDRYLSLLGKLGIKPVSLIPTSLSFKNLVEHNFSKGGGKVIAILDIGFYFTELSIFEKKDLIFSRKIPATGLDFTKSMTGVLVSDKGKSSLSLAEAERIKREIGIPGDSESKLIDGKLGTSQILSMLRPSLEQLVSEIDRCFAYYREETGKGRIDLLLLFGGGSVLKGLAEYLSGELGLVVRHGNPLEGLQIKEDIKIEKDIMPFLGSAIGAGLSFAKGINLLPSEMKERLKKRFIRLGLLGSISAIICILGLLYVGMKFKLDNLNKKIEAALLEYSTLQYPLKLAETQSLINAALSTEPYWDDVLKELSNLIPENIYITELSMKNSTISIKGIVESGEAERLISDFILSLERGIYKDVRLVMTKDIDKTTSKFEITCWVD